MHPVRSRMLALTTLATFSLAAAAGVTKTPAEVRAMLEAAAKSGDAAAQFRLGQWLENDAAGKTADVSQKELEEASHWYLLAANQDFAAAQNNLGAMYLDGRGVGRDEGLAQSYYRRAAQQGNAESETNLALLILRKHTPGEAHEALDWLTRAAKQGFAPAEAQLAQIYLDGMLLPPDDAQAVELFREAAVQHYAWGEYGYALMLQSGTGTTRDLVDAGVWMQRAADQQLPPALFDLSTMLDLGLGMPSDKKRAAILLHRAAQLGEPRAIARLRSEKS